MAIRVANSENFKKLIEQDFVIADFWGTTCVPCRLFSKIPFLNIVKLNTTDNPDIAREYGISAVPTVHFYKDGQLVDSHVGVMQPREIKEIIARYMYS